MSHFVAEADLQVTLLAHALRDSLESAWNGGAPQSFTEEEATEVGTMGLRLDRERTDERARMELVVEALRNRVAALHHAIHQLSDDPEASLDEELRCLNRQKVALEVQVLQVYEDAAALAGSIEEEVLAADVPDA